MAHRAAEDAGRAMSEERPPGKQAARAALIQARENPRWRINNLNRNKKETEKLLILLEPHQHVQEVADFIQQVRKTPASVDSRKLHYMRRRYLDGAALRDVDDMDALYRRIVSDPDAQVYRQAGRRYQVRSPREGWIAVFDPDGTRISLYHDLDDDFGDSFWTLSDLIR